MGLLYLTYDPATGALSQHLLTTSNDFATTKDVPLGTERNTSLFIGDFYHLTSIGETFTAPH